MFRKKNFFTSKLNISKQPSRKLVLHYWNWISAFYAISARLQTWMSAIWQFNPCVPTTATVAVLSLWGSIVRVIEEVETNGYPSKFGPTILHNLISLRKFKLKTIISYEQKCEARIWIFSHFSFLRSNSLKNIVKTMLDHVLLSILMCLI